LVELGIAIVSYRCRELTLRALHSLRQHLPARAWCAAVVNNSPDDGTTEAIRQLECAHIAATDAAANNGFAAGCNAAVKLLPNPARVILLLNPDTSLPDASLLTLPRYLSGHPRVGIVGAQLYNPDGTLQPCLRRFPSPRNLLLSRRSPLAKLWPGNPWTRAYLYADRDVEEPGPVDVVAGAALAIRRPLWEELGGMDEAFFLYAEDSDLCKRAWDRGWEVHHVPAARVVHAWGGSSTAHRFAAWVEHQRSLLYFMEKHGQLPRILIPPLRTLVSLQARGADLPRDRASRDQESATSARKSPPR
jgi:GT2 family glycosyltransferase